MDELTTRASKAAAWFRERGLPEAVVQALPNVVVLFGMAALPAAWTGVLCALGGGLYAASKMRAFQAAVEEGLATQATAVERVVVELGSNKAIAEASVERLERNLRPAQVEDLAVIFEEYMRSLDDEWLKLLRHAAAATAAHDTDSAVRHAVVAGLRGLRSAHIAELRRISIQVKSRRRSALPILPDKSIRSSVHRPDDLRWERFSPPLNRALVQSLQSAGFVEVREWRPQVSASELVGRIDASLSGGAGHRDRQPTGVKLRARGPIHSEAVFEYLWITEMGHAAMDLLGDRSEVSAERPGARVHHVVPTEDGALYEPAEGDLGSSSADE